MKMASSAGVVRYKFGAEKGQTGMKQKGKRKQLLLTIQALLERADCSVDEIAEAMVAGGYDVVRPAQREVRSQNHGKRNRTKPRLTTGLGDGAALDLPPSGDVANPAARPARL